MLKSESALKSKIQLSTKQNLALTVILYFVLLAVIRLIIEPYYELSDDLIFAEYIADGCYNIVFTNYFLVRIIAFVQDIIYPNNAYVLIYISLALFGMFAFVRLLIKKFSIIQASIIFSYIFCFAISSQLLIVSFTRLPALLCSVGILYLIYYYYQERWKSGYTCGFIMVLVGSMYRFKAFEAVAGVAAAYIASLIVISFIKNKKGKRITFDEFLKSLIKPAKLAIVIMLAASILFFRVASVNINTSTKELKYYNEYNFLRSALLDYDIPAYEDAPEEYDKIGIDSNDLKMLKTPHLDDEGAFTVEKLRKIKAIKDSAYNEQANLPQYLKNMMSTLIDDFRYKDGKAVLFISFLIILILYVLVIKKQKLLIPLAVSIAVFILMLYLHTKFRTPYRAAYPVWVPAMIFMLFSLDSKDCRKWFKKALKTDREKQLLMLPLLLIFMLGGLYLNMSTNEVFGINDNSDMGRQELSDYVRDNKDKFFELTGAASLFDENGDLKNIYYIKKADKNANYKTFSTTYYRLPYEDNLRKSIVKSDNMYTNLVNDGVYYVAFNNPEKYATGDNVKQYLEKYYYKDKTVGYRVVKELMEYTIYDFYIE